MDKQIFLCGLLAAASLLIGCGVPMDGIGERQHELQWRRSVSPRVLLEPRTALVAKEHQVIPAAPMALVDKMGLSCAKSACFSLEGGAKRCYRSSCRHEFLRPSLEVKAPNGGVVRAGDRLEITMRMRHVGLSDGSNLRWSNAEVFFRLPKGWKDAKHIGNYILTPYDDEMKAFPIGKARISGDNYRWSGGNLCLTKGAILLLRFSVVVGAASQADVPLQAFVYAHGSGTWTDDPRTFWGPDALRVKVAAKQP